MTFQIVIVSLLSALAATGDALLCTECRSTSSSCVGLSVTCPAGSVCGSRYSESTLTRVRTLHRTCIPSTNCTFKGSFSFRQGYANEHLGMVTSCCSTDGCTPDIPAIPPISANPNGLVCRSCMSADSTWCYTSDTIQCTGNENMCLLQTNKIKGSYSLSTATRGCVTKSFCDLGSLSTNTEELSVDIRFICTSGGLSVHKVVLTPAIVCLLMLKFFF